MSSRVVKVEISNFTEGTTQKIEDFQGVKPITGDNKTGKSLTINALAFGIGEKSEAIYGNRNRCITLTLHKDGHGSMDFRRVMYNGGNRYFVDGSKVGKGHYRERLEEYNVRTSPHLAIVFKKGCWEKFYDYVNISKVIDCQATHQDKIEDLEKLKTRLCDLQKEKANTKIETQRKKEKVKELENAIDTINTSRKQSFDKFLKKALTKTNHIHGLLTGKKGTVISLKFTQPNEPYFGRANIMVKPEGMSVGPIEAIGYGGSKLIKLSFILALHLLQGTPFLAFDDFDEQWAGATCERVRRVLDNEIGKNMQIIAVSRDTEFHKNRNCLAL